MSCSIFRVVTNGEVFRVQERKLFLWKFWKIDTGGWYEYVEYKTHADAVDAIHRYAGSQARIVETPWRIA